MVILRVPAMSLMLCGLAVFSAVADDNLSLQDFETFIRPVLVEHCYECHSLSSGKAEGGLRLDSRQAMLAGGDSGPVLAAGHPQQSLLIEALQYESFEMPPSGKLADETIDKFRAWIQAGAPDPRIDEAPAKEKVQVDWQEAEAHWAFQPLADRSIPDLDESGWSRSCIDQFVVTKLRQHSLSPAPEAGRATWLRRVTFDLVGLPPSVEELDAFLHDSRSDAYERVVERLLASPHYGERWGRYWLDLARYADTNGADENHKLPEAWRYRDYVVAALNADKPYDRFIQEQMAGDLLPASSEHQRREQLTATGFLVIGPKMLAEQDKEKLVADIVDEQLDTVGKVFLGLTLGCARCHDHKFDPITAADYYALAGVFHSTRTMEHLDHVSQWSERVLPDTETDQRIADFELKFKQQQSEFTTARLAALDAEISRGIDLLRQLWMSRIEAAEPNALAQEPTANPTANPIGDPAINSVAEPANDQSELRAELVKMFDNNESLNKLWSLSQQPSESFAPAAQQLWQSLKEAQVGHSKTSWIVALTEQSPPTSASALMDAVLSTLKERWRSVGEAYPYNDESLEKIAREDRLLFGKEGPLDATRLPGKFLEPAVAAELAAKATPLEALEKQRPTLAKAMAVDEASVKLVAIHVRGNHLQFSGEPLPRRVPTIFDSERIANLPSPKFPEQSSGRLDLARWLTDPANPLTARVMVNRIWQGHFGEGLVASSSNFGLRGDLPSHPELLDWLARDFQLHDWSIKHLHRQIVLSSTYRMAWVANAESERVDPENRLLWRQNRRRLEAEPIRDLLLTVAGRVDHAVGGEFQPLSGQYPDSGQGFSELDSPRRTILLPINRAALNEFFSTFDFLDPAASLEKRPATVVPHQTLFMMNHPLAMHAGWALAQRVTASTQSSVDRVRLAYATVLGRYPTGDEVREAEQFIHSRSPRSAEASSDPNSPADSTGKSEANEAWVRYCRSLLLVSEAITID